MKNLKCCQWISCITVATHGITSFDPFIQSKDNLSETIPYCELHINKIRNGEFEKGKLHQKYHYLINLPFDEKNNEQINEIHAVYGYKPEKNIPQYRKVGRPLKENNV